MITVKVTMKFYFDDGSEAETDLLSEDFFTPEDPEDEPYDQEAIKSSVPDIDFMAFMDDDQFFDWLYDPSSDVHYTDLIDESG